MFFSFHVNHSIHNVLIYFLIFRCIHIQSTERRILLEQILTLVVKWNIKTIWTHSIWVRRIENNTQPKRIWHLNNGVCFWFQRNCAFVPYFNATLRSFRCYSRYIKFNLNRRIFIMSPNSGEIKMWNWNEPQESKLNLKGTSSLEISKATLWSLV